MVGEGHISDIALRAVINVVALSWTPIDVYQTYLRTTKQPTG